MNRLAAIALAALALAGAAQAQTQPKWSSYPLVAAAIPKGSGDPSLEVFRATLGEIARRKDAEALRRLLPRDFFWERDFGGNFEKKKPTFANFAAALDLEAEDGIGWRRLAAFAGQIPGPHEKRRGVFCAPPAPKYDEKAFEKLLAATGSDVFDWAYPAHAHVIVRGKGEPGAPELAKLTPHFVFADLAARGPDFDYEKGWMPVITHDGKRGFVPPGELLTPLDPRLCYVKRNGNWRIAGFIGGGD